MLSIYYSKANGEIYTVTQAPNQQGFERFGNFAEDMASILDILYTEDNENIMMNTKMFIVKDGTIQIKSNALDSLNIINENEEQ